MAQPKKLSAYTVTSTLDGTERVPYQKGSTNGIFNLSAAKTSTNVKAYGAKVDGKRLQYVGVANGSNTLGCGQANFTAADIGKKLIAYQEYPDGSGIGAAFSGTILSITDGQNVVMSHNAYRALPGNDSTFIIYGTDDAAAIQAALNAADPADPSYIANDANIQLGSGYAEVVIPSGPSPDQGISMIGTQINVPTGIILDAQAMICNVTGNLSTTVPCMIFQDYTVIRQLSVEAGYGCGVQIGGTNANQSHVIAENIEVWHSGAAVGQYSVYSVGYDNRFGHIYTKGGYYGFYGDSSSDLHITEMFSIGNIIGIYLKNTQQAKILNQFCDSCRGIGLQIDGGAGNIYARVSAFAADGTTYTLNPVVAIGNLTAAVNKDIIIDVQANNTGNAVVSLANVKESLINIVASNTKLQYGNSYPITTGVAYGANVGASVTVNAVLDDTVTNPWSGTRQGVYQYDKGGVRNLVNSQVIDIVNGYGGFVGKHVNASTDTFAVLQGSFANAGNRLLDSRLSTDTQGRFVQFGDGKKEWGSGTATRDTNLYRAAVDTLKTDDKFVAQLGVNLGNPGLTAPATATTPSNKGDFAYDSGYLYIAIADNTWKRVAIATW